MKPHQIFTQRREGKDAKKVKSENSKLKKRFPAYEQRVQRRKEGKSKISRTNLHPAFCLKWHNIYFSTLMPSYVIASHEYNTAEQTLLVTFVTGKIYKYYDIPESLYQQFTKAFSKGTFFNRYIKPSRAYKRIDLEDNDHL